MSDQPPRKKIKKEPLNEFYAANLDGKVFLTPNEDVGYEAIEIVGHTKCYFRARDVPVIVEKDAVVRDDEKPSPDYVPPATWKLVRCRVDWEWIDSHPPGKDVYLCDLTPTRWGDDVYTVEWAPHDPDDHKIYWPVSRETKDIVTRDTGILPKTWAAKVSAVL
jgi:hypothetical protein